MKTMTTVTSSLNYLTITVDDQMNLFIDGAEQPNNVVPNCNKATTPDTVTIPPTVTTIAVQATNNANYSGILGSDTNGLVLTSSAWKCTPDYYNGWSNKVYDDSLWPMATEIVANDGSRFWPTIGGIRTEAKWIWSPSYTMPGGNNVVYCRCTVGQTPPSVHPPTSSPLMTTSKRMQYEYIVGYYLCSYCRWL